MIGRPGGGGGRDKPGDNGCKQETNSCGSIATGRWGSGGPATSANPTLSPHRQEVLTGKLPGKLEISILSSAQKRGGMRPCG